MNPWIRRGQRDLVAAETRLLLLEPDRATAETLIQSLGPGYGTQAVDGLPLENSRDDSPYVLILGPGLPLRDMIAACETLRSVGQANAVLCIVASTDEDSRAALTDSGADHVIAVPFTPAMLHTAVDALLTSLASRALPPATSSAAPVRPAEVGELTAEEVQRRLDDVAAFDQASAAGTRTAAAASSIPKTPAVASPNSDDIHVAAVAGRITPRLRWAMALTVGLILSASVVVAMQPAPTGAEPVAHVHPSPSTASTTSTAGTPIPSAAATSRPSSPPTASASPRASTPRPSASPAASPSLTPSASQVSAAPTKVASPPPSATPSTSALNAYALPRDPQPIRFTRRAIAPLCADAPPDGVFNAVLTQEDGIFYLILNNHRDIGSLAPDGTFDVAGIDPYEHWHGSLTDHGGDATFQVVTGMSCQQTYRIAIFFP